MSTDQLDAVAAGSVRLEDITSSEHNRILLGRIKDNDPSLNYVRLCINERAGFAYHSELILTEEDNLLLFGHFIGLNTTLTKVAINYSSGDNEPELGSFFTGLSRNKTIRRMEFQGDGFNDCEGLSSMNMPHILKLFNFGSILPRTGTLHLGENGAHNFALGLRKCKSLKEYDGILTAEIVAALSVLPRIEDVSTIGGTDGGCILFDKLLKDTKTLFHLSIPDMGLGNHGLTLLAICLKDNNTLETCTLDGNNIGDEGAEALAMALLHNRSVQKLYLEYNDIGDKGAISLAKSLGQSNISEFSLRGNLAIADRGLVAIAGALQSQKCMLSDIQLGGINIGSVGLLLGRAISNSMVTSVDFTLDEGEGIRSMGDDELGTLMEGLKNSCTLQVLKLTGHEALTAIGLRHLHPYLSSKYCTLKILDVDGIDFGDEGLLVLADALACNKSLNELWFKGWDEESATFTDVGWNALSTALCDSTSANSIYLSNHTLQHMPDEAVSVPWVLVNRVKCRSMIAKFKILQSIPDLDMTPFLQWDIKFLPLIKFWFESMSFSADIIPSEISNDWERLESTIQNRELSAIYKFIRAMSSRVALEYKTYVAEQLYIMQVMGN